MTEREDSRWSPARDHRGQLFCIVYIVHVNCIAFIYDHQGPPCPAIGIRGVRTPRRRWQLNAGDHPKYWQKTPIAVVIFSEHVKVNRGDGCSNEGFALAVLYLY